MAVVCRLVLQGEVVDDPHSHGDESLPFPPAPSFVPCPPHVVVAECLVESEGHHELDRGHAVGGLLHDREWELNLQKGGNVDKI